MYPPEQGQQGYATVPDSAGLQVVHHNSGAVSESAGPQVVHGNDGKIHVPRDDEAPEVIHEHADKEAILQPPSHTAFKLPASKNKSWRRKRLLIPAVLVTFTIILGAILGGVLGSKAASKPDLDDTPSSVSDTNPGPAPSSSTSDPVPSPTSIKPRSMLAAAALRDNGRKEDSIVLAYQRPNGDFQTTRYKKPDGGDGRWNDPQAVVLQHTPKDLAGLATCLIYLKSSVYLDMTFVNSSRHLTQMLADTTPDTLEFEQSRGYNLGRQVAFDSNFAAYGGWLVYQEANGELGVRVRFPNRGIWRFNALSEGALDAIDGTKLALVPLSTNHTRIIQEGAVGVFYQENSGKLRPKIYSQGRGAGKTPDSWPSLFPDIELPRGGSFAAFSIQRTEDENVDLVNTFILYQDKSFDIKQTWTEDGKEWKTSSPEMLKGADSGTTIACTTLGTLDVEGSRRLGPASDLTRCYFRKSGLVVEVQFDGTNWVELGNVPLP